MSTDDVEAPLRSPYPSRRELRAREEAARRQRETLDEQRERRQQSDLSRRAEQIAREAEARARGRDAEARRAGAARALAALHEAPQAATPQRTAQGRRPAEAERPADAERPAPKQPEAESRPQGRAAFSRGWADARRDHGQEAPARASWPPFSDLVADREPGDAREEERRPPTRRRHRLRTALVLVLILGMLGGGAAWAAQTLGIASVHVANPFSREVPDYPGPGRGSVTVEVRPGQYGSEIGQTLVEADVVKSVAAFTRAFNANRGASGIKPGVYLLKRQMSASQALTALVDGTTRTDSEVRVIPGQTVKQLRATLVNTFHFDADQVDRALKDTASLGLPAAAKGRLEGWLAPGSYGATGDATPRSVLRRMVRARIEQLDQMGVPEGSREQVLIKASILEREVNRDTYLPQVARVIDNRLAGRQGETRGRLQMDSTVLYGVGKSSGVPTHADLADDNPYNTYLHAGLPPSPISQPGEAAIRATLHPAAGPWLYFVTVDLDKGTTLFATTQEQQRENTKKFTAYCHAHPGKC